MSEERIVSLELYATIGVTVPHAVPVRKYPVLASGRCRVCDKEIVIIDTGCFHLNGDEVDIGGAAGHQPRMAYCDLFRDVVPKVMQPFIGNTAITQSSMETMRKMVEEACRAKIRACVGVHPNDPNPFPEVRAHQGPFDQVNFVFVPDDFIPFSDPTLQ